MPHVFPFIEKMERRRKETRKEKILAASSSSQMLDFSYFPPTLVICTFLKLI
jgi:hypothetical protein